MESARAILMGIVLVVNHDTIQTKPDAQPVRQRIDMDIADVFRFDGVHDNVIDDVNDRLAGLRRDMPILMFLSGRS
jgi:hypothetical protein